MEKRIRAPVAVIVIALVLTGFWILLSWDSKQKAAREAVDVAKVSAILQGDHPLRKITERTESSLAGSFFLVVGEVNGRTSSVVKFAWKMNDGTYAISSLQLEKIRVRFDENATTPTIRFHWEQPYFATDQVQELMNSVLYATLTIRENDWPIQVQLPLNASLSK